MNGPEVVSHLNLGARGFTCNVERGNVVKALQRGDLRAKRKGIQRRRGERRRCGDLSCSGGACSYSIRQREREMIVVCDSDLRWWWQRWRHRQIPDYRSVICCLCLAVSTDWFLLSNHLSKDVPFCQLTNQNLRFGFNENFMMMKKGASNQNQNQMFQESLGPDSLSRILLHWEIMNG